MAHTTIVFGLLLTGLGLVGYFLAGGVSVTALIPAFFGIVLLALGFLARSEPMRKHAMHAAAAVALIGFLGALMSLLDRKSTRLNSSHSQISYAVFCLKKKKKQHHVNVSIPILILIN